MKWLFLFISVSLLSVTMLLCHLYKVVKMFQERLQKRNDVSVSGPFCVLHTYIPWLSNWQWFGRELHHISGCLSDRLQSSSWIHSGQYKKIYQEKLQKYHYNLHCTNLRWFVRFGHQFKYFKMLQVFRVKVVNQWKNKMFYVWGYCNGRWNYLHISLKCHGKKRF